MPTSKHPITLTELSFQYPTWYLLFCFALGGLFAALLYWRDAQVPAQPAWLRPALALLRGLAATLIALLLLSPLLKREQRETRKPVVVLAQDASASVGTALGEADSAAYLRAFEALRENLSENYDVAVYAFGEKVRQGFDGRFQDRASNLSELLQNIDDRYGRQNLGALIMASDGLYNQGSNPAYAGTQLGVPVYTIALGDTTIKKDAVLKRVFHNRIAYLNDKFKVQADIMVRNAAGSTAKLSIAKVEKGGQLRPLQEFPINIGSQDFFSTQDITLDADAPGVQRYRLSISSLPNEVSSANNSKDIFVEVLDARQRILILAASPHPDVAALRAALLNNQNYQVEIAYGEGRDKDLARYDLAILHQVPAIDKAGAAALKTLYDNKVPIWYIMGSQSDVARLSQVQGLVAMQANLQSLNDVQASMVEGFKLFTLSDELRQNLRKFPPLLAPFGDYKASNAATVLLAQKIGSVESSYPLLAFGEQNDTKIAILCAEGIWKWRLFDFAQHQKHELFNELVGKIIQYLNAKEDRRRFRAYVSKNIFDENENILFDAELYNNSYEPVNEPDVSLSIFDEEGQDYTYTFSRSGSAYALNVGYLPVGNYTYRASVSYNGERMEAEGRFSVQPVQLESYETSADHGLLRLLSAEHGGSSIGPADMAGLPALIRANEQVRPVIYSSLQTKPLIHLKWLFLLLILSLGLEWFLRRYHGTY